MARFAYFADLADGTTLEWRDRTEECGTNQFGAKRYREVPARIDNRGREGMFAYAEGRGWVKVTRKVEMKAAPSRHECDDRCMNATGRVMRCECACGGKNHGRGAFVCA